MRRVRKVEKGSCLNLTRLVWRILTFWLLDTNENGGWLFAKALRTSVGVE